MAAGKPGEPVFAVVTRSLDVDWAARPFADPQGGRSIVITCETADPGRMERARRVADVIVAEVLESEGMLADSGSAVELVIDRADVAEVLAAITSGASLSIVPIGAGS